MVISTGMMVPICAAVFSLYPLINSIILMPYGPSVEPTGGAGVALPAGIWSLTTAVTFFAMTSSSFHIYTQTARTVPQNRRAGTLERNPKFSRSLSRLNHFFDLLEIQFYGRLAAKDRDQHAQLLLLRVHLLDLAGKLGERPGGDAHDLALFKFSHRHRHVALDGIQD